jgi:SprT protein
MDSETLRLLLSEHVPAASVDYCVDLWDRYRFEFTLRRSRVTKIGDFTVRGRLSRITVNRDLHPFLFLITYVHEVAHLEVHLRGGRRAESHGAEWKKDFQRLMAPVLRSDVFPDDLLTALQEHMVNPRATTFSDTDLTHAFRRYDPRATTLTFLADIPSGSVFELRGRWFKKGETKRTRVLCQEMKSRRKYFVPADAEVQNVQLSLL